MGKPILPKNTRLKTAYIFLILFLFSFAFASASYTERGTGSKDYYINGRTLFNDLYSSTFGAPDIYSVSINNPQLQGALIYDLNADGVKEMIIASGNTIRIYADSQFTLLNTTTAGGKIDNYKIYSYGGSVYLLASYPKTLTFMGTQSSFEYLDTFRYNANISNFQKIATRDDYINASGIMIYPPILYHPNAYAFGCQENICFFYAKPSTIFGANAGSAEYTIQSFLIDDTSGLPDGVSYGLTHWNNPIFDVQPMINDIHISEIYGDGHLSVIATDGYYNVQTHDFTPYLRVYKYHADTGNFSVYTQALQTINYDLGLTYVNENQDAVSALISSPLVGDFIPDGEPSQSIIIGFLDSADGFRLHSYYWDGSAFYQYARHPQHHSYSGNMLSNPVKAKVFDHDNHNNYCILAYTTTNQSVLDCATDYGGRITLNNPFGYTEKVYYTANYTNDFFPNVSSGQGQIHTIYASNTISKNQRITDFILPFGIYQLSAIDTISGSLNPIFNVAYGQGTLTPIDLKDTSYYDLIFMSANNAVYIDDKQNNQNGQSDSINFNPCIRTQWKIGTRVNVLVTTYDAEANQVRAAATLYYGTSYAQNSNYSAFFPPGSLLSFDFNASTATTNGILRIFTQDDRPQHANLNVTRDYPFSVGDTGLSFGDGQCAFNGLVSADNAAAAAAQAQNTTATTLENNALKTSVASISGLIGIPTLLFILIMMVGIDIVVVISSMSNPFLASHLITIAGLLLFIDMAIFIIASLMGLIPAALVITIILLVVIAAILYIGFLLSKLGSGGN
jgi:hypothetical protein